MFFTHGGKAYTLPTESVVKQCSCSISLGYSEFLELTDRAYGFCAETFLNSQVHGQSIAQNHILVVNTEAGMVWCSQILVKLPKSAREKFGIGDSLVGCEFVWPWNPGRATVSWLRFVDAERNDGQYRALAHLSPRRRDMSATLAPELVRGCVEVPWGEMTDGQRFFLSHINATAKSLCTASNPDWDAGYVADARKSIMKRRRMQGNESREPLYMTVADDDLIASERLTEANSDPERFFDMRRRVRSGREAQEIFSYQRVTYTDWARLPQELSNCILESIAEEAFRSSWQDYQAAQAVADLRLVCRQFRDTLDASLGSLWKENAEFSRRVLKGSLSPAPAVQPSIGLASVVSTAQCADTWRKLANLRRVSGVKRKKQAFVFNGSVPKRLTFGEANREDMQELQRLNEHAHAQCDVYFF